MSSTEDVLREALRLADAGEAYSLATVVGVVRPASARRGDRALVTAEGALVGWVGGACSEPIVVREALRALADGRPRLVRIAPAGRGDREDDDEEVVIAQSMCASEGVVEVLVEPQLPRPSLAVFGESPAARVLAELAETIGWRVSREIDRNADAVVVASMGHGDEEALAAALAAGAGYVALVASARRASVVLAGLRDAGVAEESLARVRAPAGLDLGPSSQEEIAVAVLAEIIAWRHARPVDELEPAEAVDPVCGMVVAVHGAESSEHADVAYFFCSAACRERFEGEPARYAPAVGS